MCPLDPCTHPANAIWYEYQILDEVEFDPLLLPIPLLKWGIYVSLVGLRPVVLLELVEEVNRPFCLTFVTHDAASTLSLKTNVVILAECFLFSREILHLTTVLKKHNITFV